MESLTAFNEITTYWICREQIWDNIDDKDLLEQMFFLVLNRLFYFTSSAHRAKKKINAVEFAFDTLESRAHPPRKGRKAHTAEPTTAVPTITEPLPIQPKVVHYAHTRSRLCPDTFRFFFFFLIR